MHVFFKFDLSTHTSCGICTHFINYLYSDEAHKQQQTGNTRQRKATHCLQITVIFQLPILPASGTFLNKLSQSKQDPFSVRCFPLPQQGGTGTVAISFLNSVFFLKHASSHPSTPFKLFHRQNLSIVKCMQHSRDHRRIPKLYEKFMKAGKYG